jgi:hypothetical protein
MIGISDIPLPPARPIEESIEAQLVTALRVELEEYGALLRAYEAEQQALLDRKLERAREQSAEIEVQRVKARLCRKRREKLAVTIAQSNGCAQQTSLRELVPFFPPAVRPMIEALTDEVNRLINHTRRRAQQNEALLARIS